MNISDSIFSGNIFVSLHRRICRKSPRYPCCSFLPTDEKHNKHFDSGNAFSIILVMHSDIFFNSTECNLYSCRIIIPFAWDFISLHFNRIERLDNPIEISPYQISPNKLI